MKSEDNRGIKADLNSEEFILRFDSESDDFSRGFACGEIWACLSDGAEEVHCIAPISNTEMIMRMAEASKYSFVARDLTIEEFKALKIDDNFDNWMIVVLRSDNE